jgi:hypothetical protein
MPTAERARPFPSALEAAPSPLATVYAQVLWRQQMPPATVIWDILQSDAAPLGGACL